MQRTDFHYDLPDELIAQTPLANRTDSRLLELRGSSGEMTHRSFQDLPQLLNPGDLLVFNNTRVLPARLYGVKETGGRVEILIERLRDERSLLAHVRASKSPKPGSKINLVAEPGADVSQFFLSVSGREGDLFVLECGEPVAPIMAELGHMPLPPYIDRADAELDRERYQTVFAHRDGAVAAPTAGLHFDADMLDRLRAKGVKSTNVTLHVGAGTFQPVRSDDIRDHQIHHEWLEVDESACEAVRRAQAEGKRIVAVGTTAVRSLETAAANGDIAPYTGDTNLYIYPGYRFNCVDAMITNFHLPESTLLMLVSAFCGQNEIMTAYEEAVQERYRFFSYGDAMFLTPKDTMI